MDRNTNPEDRALAEAMGIDLERGEPLKGEYYAHRAAQVMLPVLSFVVTIALIFGFGNVWGVIPAGILGALLGIATVPSMIVLSVRCGWCARQLRTELDAWAAYADAAVQAKTAGEAL